MILSLCEEVSLMGTNIRGIKGNNIDKESGYLCDPLDVKDYAAVIVKLTNVEHRQALRKNCYGIVKRFDIEISRAQMANIRQCYLLERFE